VSRDPGWIAQLAVGQLRGKDGFGNDAETAVENLVRCVIAGNMYSPYLPTRTDIRSESLSIDGNNGWLIDCEITVDRPDLRLQVIIRSSSWYAMARTGAFSSVQVPIGNAQLDAVLAKTIRELRAS
jgi:hypothetical protein